MKLSRQRILEIGNYPPPYCGWSVRTKFVVDELRAIGVDCKVLNIGPSRKVRRPDCIDVQSAIDYLRKLIGLALGRYRFHAHVNGDSPKGFALTLAALVIGRTSGRRPVLTFHAGASQRYFPTSNPAVRFMFKLLFGLAGEIICNNMSVKRAIASCGASLSKIHVIPAFSGRHVEGITEADPLPVRFARFAGNHSPLLLCYAYNRPEFALETFFRVIADIASEWNGLGIFLVGPRADDAELLAQIYEMGLIHRVYMAGNVTHNDFLALLRVSDLYVRTHLRDGVSSSVLEALTVGTPVIAAENESRPAGVVTYHGTNEQDLQIKLRELLAGGFDHLEPVPPTPSEDTLNAEVNVLLRNGRPERTEAA